MEILKKMDLENLTIKTFHEGITEKKFSALEVTKAFFDVIESRDASLFAYVRLTKDAALSRAQKVDAEGVREGSSMLAGVPLAIKDNILIEGEVASAGSKMLQHYRASYDATVITKLKNANAVFLGTTNMDEFAMGSSTETSAFQKTRNPYDTERVPGGSSGGSAAAVASGMALGALGSDTGGSIRQPAAFCGVVGLKPTYGTVSRHGLIAMASSLDQIGPFANTVEDAAILFDAMRGEDGFDSTSVRMPDVAISIDDDSVKNLVIGLPREYFSHEMDPVIQKEIQGVIETLKKEGFTFKEIDLPHTKYAVSCYYIIMPAEVSSNLARFEGIRYARNHIEFSSPDTYKNALEELYATQRGAGFGEEVKRRILLGTFVLSSGYYDAYYAKAQKVRRLITEDFAAAFKDVDVILTPVTPTLPFRVGEKINDPLAMYLSDIFTIPANLAGLPALSLPTKPYRVGGGELPVGFQLIGNHFEESAILGLGHYYEQLHAS